MIPAFPIYLFDIDGTLLDSARDICGAVQQVLETTTCGPVTFEFLKGYIGLHLIDNVSVARLGERCFAMPAFATSHPFEQPGYKAPGKH